MTLRAEYQSVGGRLVDVNELPRRVWIDEWNKRGMRPWDGWKPLG
ncbi:hypothetical protein [Nocardia australiensis]|nr:hypothetical protein [Nocardia australiensis]